MPRVVKHSASQAGRQVRAVAPKPRPFAVRHSAAFPASPEATVRASVLHELKLDGYRMAARIDNGRVQLLTRAGLDWTDKYPSAIAAPSRTWNVKTAYIDGELCGVDEAGLPTFAHTQAATDGERNVQLVYYAFDLLHLDGWDVSALQLIERKALLEPLLANKPAIRSMAVRRKWYFKGPRDDRREVVAIDRRAGSTPQSGPVFSTFPPRERCLRAGYFERWVDPPRQLRPAQGEKCRMRPAVGGMSRPRCAPHEVQACRHAGRGRFVAFGRRAEGARIAATATGRVATNASASSDTIAN